MPCHQDPYPNKSSNTKCLVEARVQNDFVDGRDDFIGATMDTPNVITEDDFDAIAWPPMRKMVVIVRA